MTKDDYWGKFLPFITLFFILGIFLLFIPDLLDYGLSFICSISICLVVIASKLISGKKIDDILFYIDLYMLFTFITVFFLVVTLGGVIHSAFSSLLTTSLLFLLFSFDTFSSKKKNKIVKYISVFVYIFTCVMFEPNIFGSSYENPILGSFTSEKAEKIIASVEFQRVSFFMFTVCALNAIWNLPFCYKYRIVAKNLIS